MDSPGFHPWPGSLCCVLGQGSFSHNAFLHPGGGGVGSKFHFSANFLPKSQSDSHFFVCNSQSHWPECHFLSGKKQQNKTKTTTKKRFPFYAFRRWEREREGWRMQPVMDSRIPSKGWKSTSRRFMLQPKSHLAPEIASAGTDLPSKLLDFRDIFFIMF